MKFDLNLRQLKLGLLQSVFSYSSVLLLVTIFVAGCVKKTANQNGEWLTLAQFAQSEGALTASEDCNEDCQKYRQEFRYIVYVGKQIYCYWDIKKVDTGVDYDALASSLEASIVSDLTVTGYYKILAQWASSFHDGHVNAFPIKSGIVDVFTAPVRLEVLAPATDHEKVIVTISGEVPGVRVGDEVIRVNGVEIKTALDKAAEQVSGSTARMRRYGASRRLVDAIGAKDGAMPLVLTLRRAGGSVHDVSIGREVSVGIPNPSVPPAEERDNGPVDSVKILTGGIGYIHIESFTGADDDKIFDVLMDRLAETNGLILDLRDNGGGDLSGNQLIARFIDQKVTRYRQSERWSDYLIANRPDVFFLPREAGADYVNWHDVEVEPTTRYSMPVVALTSTYCFSACDTFVAALKANQLATIVGEPTGGGTGTPLVFELPSSGLYFRYSVIRGQTPSGDLIEGVGTSPDIYIEPTVKDRVTKQDSQLAKAIEVIQAAGQGGKPASVTADEIGQIAVERHELQFVSPLLQEFNRLLKLKDSDEL
jgi:C-terminal processing protease CtpA/Prc